MKRIIRSHTEKVIQNEIDKASSDKKGGERESCQIGIRDQRALLELDIRRILTNQVAVINDRERSPR